MTVPTFPEFYEAVHGRPPFPWQERLAASLGAGQPWPREIGVPTGLGKTSCLDIAVWWLASQAHRCPAERSAPTRIWWLVNRRLLIDATAVHAERLAALLAQVDGGPLEAVGGSLRSLCTGGEGPPLQVVRLRGGMAADRPLDPAQPAIVLATLPMYGSRLLFRGYGSSRSMRPVDAALAGTDSLLLVDEAHLVRPLLNLFGPLDECDVAEQRVLPPPRHRPAVVSLTATGDPGEPGRFDLDEEDRAHQVVALRLAAGKPMQVRVGKPHSDPAPLLAQAARDLLEERERPAACVVFANTPSTAVRTAGHLTKAVDADVVVLTGRMREREAAAGRDRLLDPDQGVRAGDVHQRRTKPLVAVVTQTLEVGADVDFELLVTEACGVRALTQRLGRLNRLGLHLDARAVYVHVEPKARGTSLPEWPVYGTEPLTVLTRLEASVHDGHVDLGPARVSEVLGLPQDEPGRSPELLPAHLAEWVKTTNPPPGEAPPEPFFSGLARPERRVSVCWRAHVPEPGELLWPRVSDSELVEVALGDVVTAVEGGDLRRLAADRVSVEGVAPDGLRPGDVVLLPADAGRYGSHGWDPDHRGTVADVSILAAGIPLDVQAFGRLVVDPPLAHLRALLDADDDPEEAAQRVEELLSALRDAEPRALETVEWLALLAHIDVPAGLQHPPAQVPRLLAVTESSGGRADELDELSAGSAAAVGLAAHGAAVGDRAAMVGAAIGLPSELVATVKLAGRLHDEGKADVRFQRWLDPKGAASEAVAKSTTQRRRWLADRIAAGWPAGGRHEELSGRLVLAWLDAGPDLPPGVDRDLLVHLVVSHHGRGRPLLLPVEDSAPGKLGAVIDGVQVSVDADLAVVDWAQPDRFASLNRRYGAWGLALLEAVVRQGDHVVSSRGWTAAVPEVV